MTDNLHDAIFRLEDDFHTLKDLSRLAHALAIDDFIHPDNKADYEGFTRLLGTIHEKASGLVASWEMLFDLSCEARADHE